jgi:hypothetical protein
MEYGRTGAMGYWSIGVLENWSVGGTVVQVLLVQYSITPIFLTPPLLLRI